MGCDKSQWEEGKGDKEQSGVQELHSALLEVMRFREQAQKGGLCKTAS